ncbi:YybH family protein [Dechloromonas sp. A34]|uniref:YybH family protein n=1 Tax=Dechloromonas sp. A34 TaxID=447588 RepID=UPI0022499BB0|nr:nuclear transport factor 2 family protein [Dechloromonas sp. A34]
MRNSLLVFLLSLVLGTSLAFGEDERAADRQQLLGILGDIEHGINDANIELMVRHIDDKAVVTWLNAEVSQGPDGVRAYFKRMVGSGPDTVLSKYQTHPKISQPAIFYGDVAVANGTTEDEFTPHRRSVFNFSSRWTASLRKVDGQWKIIALNLSTNTFNNALISELERFALLTGVGGLLGGLLLAAAWAYFRRRRPV